MVVEVQQLENHENRVFWCGFGFHQDFCIGTVIAPEGLIDLMISALTGTTFKTS